jgi:hypothetical protein
MLIVLALFWLSRNTKGRDMIYNGQVLDICREKPPTGGRYISSSESVLGVIVDGKFCVFADCLWIVGRSDSVDSVNRLDKIFERNKK